MLLVLKIILGLSAVVLLLLGLIWMFKPSKIMSELQIESHSATGYNFLRGDIGGLLIAGCIFIALFLYEGPERWYLPGVILLCAVILGRLISLIADGRSLKGIQSIGAEVACLVLMTVIKYLS